MAAVRQYRFRALVTLAPAAGEGPARRLPSRVRALTAHACCLIQPAGHHEYFPAVISRDEELPLSPAGHAMMTVALADGEAEALFARGQPFTIWADGTVGRTIRAEGLVGYGVICSQASPPPAGLADDRIHLGTAGPVPGHDRPEAGAQAAGEGSAA
jgi:hypothetical protein